jgi:peptide/nickel transport system substrate-binding protein
MPYKTRAFLLAGAASFLVLLPQANADEVTIALRVAVNTLDPHMSASVGSDLSVLSHIYPALILRGPDLQLQPALAESWELVDDTTWRFKLTPGATFANGEKIDAHAVTWNLDRVLDEDVGARIAGWFSLVSEAIVVDDLTVEVKTSEPYPAFADQLSMFFLLPPEWAQSHNPATETMSGGRYQVVANVPGDHITLEANPDYWGEAPAFQRVTFRTIPETGSRIAALMAGEVDLLTGLPTTEIARVNQSAVASADAIDSIRMMLGKINHQKAPMENRAFRQALNYAVDKEGIVAAIFDGKATVSACQLLSEPYVGFNPDLEPYPYDPEKARELLQESGVDLSQEIEIEVPTATYLQGDEVTQIIAAQLQDVGLNVTITEIEFGAFMNKQLRARDLAQIAVQGLAWPTIDADGMLTMFAPGNGYDYWDNAEFGAILDEARVTTDRDRRDALYAEATKLMCDEAAAIFLYLQPATYGVSNRIEWAARGDDWVRAFDMKPAAQ